MARAIGIVPINYLLTLLQDFNINDTWEEDQPFAYNSLDLDPDISESQQSLDRMGYCQVFKCIRVLVDTLVI